MTRDDIDPQKPLVKLLLVSRSDWRHPNGTTISEGDRNGYRAVMKTGETRSFYVAHARRYELRLA